MIRGNATFYLLPMEGGTPEGAEVGFQIWMKTHVGRAPPRIVIPSEAEGSSLHSGKTVSLETAVPKHCYSIIA